MRKIFAFLIVFMVLFICVSIDAESREGPESHSVFENDLVLNGCEIKIYKCSSIDHENIIVHNQIKSDEMNCLSYHYDYKRILYINLNNGPDIIGVCKKPLWYPPKKVYSINGGVICSG